MVDEDELVGTCSANAAWHRFTTRLTCGQRAITAFLITLTPPTDVLYYLLSLYYLSHIFSLTTSSPQNDYVTIRSSDHLLTRARRSQPSRQGLISYLRVDAQQIFGRINDTRDFDRV